MIKNGQQKCLEIYRYIVFLSNQVYVAHVHMQKKYDTLSYESMYVLFFILG